VPDVLGDGDAAGDDAAAAEAPAVGCAAPAVAALVSAAALAEARACAVFSPDTALMLETSRETARARPTISVITGVGIFMPRGTQHDPQVVQRFRITSG
jgi:hypothetical protein